MDRPALARHESQLVDRCARSLSAIPGVRVVGQPANRVGAVSFVLEDPPVSALDVGTRLDLEGIAVRTGHHCCHPDHMGVLGTVRASFSVYNTVEEVAALAACVSSIAGRKSRPRSQAATAPGPDLRPLNYPAASAASVEAAAEEFAAEFEGLQDWAERYAYLIDLGRHLPSMPSDLKTEANRVRGCRLGPIAYSFAVAALPLSPLASASSTFCP